MTTPTTTEQPTQAGPPGYAPCRRKCGRWTEAGSMMGCWTCCVGKPNGLKGEAIFPDWTPPVAPPTPAPARERRAGQRWLCFEHTTKVISEGTLTGEHRVGCWMLAEPTHDATGWSDRRWTSQGFTMTLISDAPATSEPGRPETLECSKCGAPNGVCEHFQSARPAQEAAKAPVVVCIDCDRAPIDRQTPMRFVGKAMRARPICDDCYLTRESHVGDFEYTPYNGPTRLPRPRLTHSAMWADWAEDAS